MKLSFDGIRTSLAYQYNDLVDEFNDLVRTGLIGEQRNIADQMKETLRRMKGTVGGLLAAYDERDQPDDCNMLADTISLARIEDDEDEDEEDEDEE